MSTASRALERRTDRRGFIARTAIVGSALTVNPLGYLLRPISAEAAICNCSGSSCDCAALCCDGYTEFCCTLTGDNACPPGTLAGGWWKADGSGFCDVGGSARARYYLDCNAGCGGCGCGSTGLCDGSCSGTVCGCANGSCGNRKAGCTKFRYGQCNQAVRCLGPIVCRVVTCLPPWELDASCTTTVLTDNNTRFHDAPCLHEPPCEPGWSAWYSQGGVLAAGTSVVSPSANRIDVFAIAGSSANRLFQRTWAGSWGVWGDLGQPAGVSLSGTPGSVTWQNGRIDVFARGSDGALWQRFNVPGVGWGNWVNLGGVLAGGVSVVSPVANRIDVFAVAGSSGDRLFTRTWAGSWGPWTDLGRPASAGLTGAPGAVVWQNGRIDVFARGTDGALWQRWLLSGVWSAWVSLGGLLRTGPTAVSPRAGHLNVFAVAGSSADRLFVRSWDGVWGPWTDLGRPATTGLNAQPGAVTWNSGRVDVFTRGHNGAAWQNYNPCL